MLEGLGRYGIITKVVMRLMEAPTNVLFIKMDYDDFQTASADLALLAKDGRFHHLDGRGAGRPAGGVGYVEGGAFYDAPNTPDRRRSDLREAQKFAKKTATVMTYEQYFRREEVCGPPRRCRSLRHSLVELCAIHVGHTGQRVRVYRHACRPGGGPRSSVRSRGCQTRKSSTASSCHARCRRGPIRNP